VKVVILAGGVGSRLSEETGTKPKPMVEIGGRPILWHIMKMYASHGFRDFVIALGYKGEYIKRFMVDYAALAGDLTVSLRDGRYMAHRCVDDWHVELVDTGLETETGGRLKRLAPFLTEQTFLMTYGDGVSSVDIRRSIAFHRAHGKLATMTAVRPPAGLGALAIGPDRAVTSVTRTGQASAGWINGGFFVLEREVLDYIADDTISFQREPLMKLAEQKDLMAYQHDGFWQCMDTVRDREYLEALWECGHAPWRVWP
jgi:glucose-1-phosphate cytidylyltransferase